MLTRISIERFSPKNKPLIMIIQEMVKQTPPHSMQERKAAFLTEVKKRKSP